MTKVQELMWKLPCDQRTELLNSTNTVNTIRQLRDNQADLDAEQLKCLQHIKMMLGLFKNYSNNSRFSSSNLNLLMVFDYEKKFKQILSRLKQHITSQDKENFDIESLKETLNDLIKVRIKFDSDKIEHDILYQVWLLFDLDKLKVKFGVNEACLNADKILAFNEICSFLFTPTQAKIMLNGIKSNAKSEYARKVAFLTSLYNSQEQEKPVLADGAGDSVAKQERKVVFLEKLFIVRLEVRQKDFFHLSSVTSHPSTNNSMNWMEYVSTQPESDASKIHEPLSDGNKQKFNDNDVFLFTTVYTDIQKEIEPNERIKRIKEAKANEIGALDAKIDSEIEKLKKISARLMNLANRCERPEELEQLTRAHKDKTLEIYRLKEKKVHYQKEISEKWDAMLAELHSEDFLILTIERENLERLKNGDQTFSDSTDRSDDFSDLPLMQSLEDIEAHAELKYEESKFSSDELGSATSSPALTSFSKRNPSLTDISKSSTSPRTERGFRSKPL